MPELKVTQQHLKNDAYLYIRQSTPRQVLENTESTQRQYALRDRAVALGWPVMFCLPVAVSVASESACEAGAATRFRIAAACGGAWRRTSPSRRGDEPPLPVRSTTAGARAGRAALVDEPRRPHEPRPLRLDGVAAQLCGRVRPDTRDPSARFGACGR